MFLHTICRLSSVWGGVLWDEKTNYLLNSMIKGKGFRPNLNGEDSNERQESFCKFTITVYGPLCDLSQAKHWN